MIQAPVAATFPCLELSDLSQKGAWMWTSSYFAWTVRKAVLVQNWLCLTMTEQTNSLSIILHMLKSADKPPLFILLFTILVAVCLDCSREKQYCQTLTGAPESPKQRSSDEKLV